MANQQPSASEYVPASTGKPFAEMSGSEKITFFGKVVIMLITGGFVFPNVFVE